VFLAPKPRQAGYPPTLAEIKGNFPLPGRYHFRFKAPLVPGSDRDKGAMAVWMDVTDDRKHVPTWKSGIVAKVTRIGVEEFDDDDDDDSDFARVAATNPVSNHTPAPAPPPQRQSSVQSNSSSPSLDIFDGGPVSNSASQHSMSAPPSGAGPNLLDGHHTPTPMQASGVSPASNNNKDSLLDFNTHAPAPSSSSNAHADFFGMTATPSPPVSGNYAATSMAQQQQQAQQRQRQQQMFQQQQRPPQPQQQGQFGGFNQQSGPFSDLAWK